MPRHLAALAFYLALATGLTWPLVTRLSSAVPDRGDPLLNSWIVDWVCHSLTHAPLDLFDAPIYYPARDMLAFSEHMTGIAILVLPFHLAGLPALAVYNIALLLGFALSGYGAWVLARLVVRNDAAALVAGVIHAFASFKIAHVEHLQIVSSGWLPLLLAALLFYWRKPGWKAAAMLAAAFVMNGLTNIHWLLFGGFALVITIAFLQFARPMRDRAFWLRLAAALALAAALLLPFLIPYQRVAQRYGSRRTTAEARLGSATPVHWLVASSRNIVYGRLFGSLRAAERELFPGLAAIALIVAAIVCRRRENEEESEASLPSPRRRTALDVSIALCIVLAVAATLAGRVRIGPVSFAGGDVPAVLATSMLLYRFAPRLRSALSRSRFNTEEWTAALWVGIGFLGSLGWNFFLHPFLFRVFVPFRATRTPARWAAIAYVGIAVLAAVGAAAVLGAMQGRWRQATAAALVALAAIDVSARVNWTTVAEPAPAYRWLREVRPRAVLELPLVAPDVPFVYLHAATTHRVPLVNGTSGFETPEHQYLRNFEESLRFEESFLVAVRKGGAELLIVHEERLSDERRRALSPLLARLPLVRRFGRDAVYAIPSAGG